MGGSFRVDAQDVGLFLVLMVLSELVFSSLGAPSAILGTFYLALFIHIGFTLYCGGFPPWRSATWLMLIAAWIGAECLAFASYVAPWGQLGFWLEGHPTLGGLLRGWPTPHWPLLALALLGLDLVAANYARWRAGSWQSLAVFVLAAFLAALALGWLAALLFPAAAALQAAQPELRIAPDWYTLPFYAMLRAVPWKLAGVILALASVFPLFLWPWAGAEALRRGPLGRIWLLACLLLAAAWIGLVILASRSPEDDILLATRLLTAFYFAFFLGLVPLLHRLACRPAG